MIELHQVRKQYQRRDQVVDALRPVSLTISSGEFVAIVGPSGSGKTTLLSLLGGMLSPTSGRVTLGGRAVYELSVAERARMRNEQIGFVFQHFNLIPWLTAVENVQLPLSLYGTDRHVQQTRACELLERFGLSQRRDHRPGELSAGQQQRVALARTLITNPPLILADEPTGNLDPSSREVVLDVLHESHAEGKTIVLVTHDLAVAAAAGRTLQIVDGQVSEQNSGRTSNAA